jgi:hypothetical protein
MTPENTDPEIAKKWPGTKNLRPAWGKDNPPPTSGGPKGPHLSTILRKMMGCKTPAQAEAHIRAEYPDLVDEKITRAHMYMARIDRAALKGEEWALKMVLDRIDGRVKDSSEDSNITKIQIFKIGDQEVSF